MLWEEGQKRTVREERSRMSELFVTVSDAMVAAMGRTGQLKGTPKLPEYLERPDPVVRQELARQGLAALVRDFPGNVGKPEFEN